MDYFERINEIDSKYCKNGCAQIMHPYLKGCMTILDSDGVLYHEADKHIIYINKYLDDDRRFNFPYSDIPTHYERQGLKKIKMVNQIFDFDKPYIVLSNGTITEEYVIKHYNGAIIFTSAIVPTNLELKTLTEEELIHLVNDEKADSQKYDLNGHIYTKNPIRTDDIAGQIKNAYSKSKAISHPNVSITLQQAYDNFGQDRSVKEQMGLLEDWIDLNILDVVLVYRENGEITELKYIYSTMKDTDEYLTEIYTLPVKKYSLQSFNELNHNPRIRTLDEPKIKRRLKK